MLLQILTRQSLAASGAPGVEAAALATRLCRCLSTSVPQLASAQPQQEEHSTSQQQQQSSQQQGEGTAAEDSTQKVFQTFSRFGSSFKRAAGTTASLGDHGDVLNSVVKEVKDVFRSADNIRSATRLYTGPVMEAKEGDGTTALQVVRQQQTAWEKLQEKVSGLPFFSKFSSFKVQDTAAYKKGQEALEDLKEKYETSDHPMVHKMDEVKEKLLSGSESSRAMREIRMRDPGWDMNNFVRSVKMDAPVVVRALLHKDMEALSLHLGPEMMERLGGIFKHEAEKGWYEDPTILFVSDVEIVEVRLMDNDPFIVAQFHCQQIKCSRDKFGNVVEGDPNSIQRVYYFWGLQQEQTGVVTADGEVLPPRWVIRDMMWQSMLALV